VIAIDPRISDFIKDAPIFMQPWWLEAVAPGRWDYVISYKGDQVAAVWPYTYKVRFGLRTIQMPEATPYLGPWLRKSKAKRVKQYSEQFRFLADLVSRFPEFLAFSQRLCPEIRNGLPLHWEGFECSILYTYLFAGIKGMEQVWAGLKENIRTDIKKAQRVLEVSVSDDFEIVLKMVKMTLSRQGMKLPETDIFTRHLDRVCAEHKSRRILVGRDSSDRIYGMAYLLYDNQKVYYYRAGSDPELRNTGVSSLLVYKAIEFAVDNGLDFDFEGSMKESISRFFAGFGAELTPYYSISKYGHVLVPLAQKILSRVKG